MTPQQYKTLVLILFIPLAQTYAQKFSIKLLGGYQIDANGKYLKNNSVIFLEDGTKKEETIENAKNNSASGLITGLSLGYQVKKHLSLDMKINYFKGANTNYYRYYEQVNQIKGRTDIGSSLNLALFSPSFTLNLPKNKFSPYASFGIVFGFGSQERVTSSNSAYKDGTRSENLRIVKLSGGMVLGYQTSVGMLFNLTKYLDIFSELQINAVSYSPKKSTVTAYSYDGIDILSSLSPRFKEINFVDRLSSNSNETIDLNKPSESLRYSIPLNSIGFQVGLRYTL